MILQQFLILLKALTGQLGAESGALCGEGSLAVVGAAPRQYALQAPAWSQSLRHLAVDSEINEYG